MRYTRYVRPLAAFLASFTFGACRTASPFTHLGPTPDSSSVDRDVRTLASDSWAGRGTGTPGNDSARMYIANRFLALGLRGPFVATTCAPGERCSDQYVQPFVARMSGAERNGLPPQMPTANVAAIVEGTDPAMRNQYVVIGAHYDHLGTRAFNARDPELPNAVRNGADDNASGVATVLELARLLKRTPPKRSVLLVAFSAEELGLLGAEHFVANTPVPLESVQAMLNFDMVGRLRDDKLLIYGTATATELSEIVSGANMTSGLKVNAVGDGEGPSDHAAFYRKNLPVLHFFTDLHDDYHKSTDDADKINVGGMLRVAALAERIARNLADRPNRLTFVRVPTVARAGASRTGSSVWLGSVPDMGASDVKGLRLGGVSPGSPAEKAGLKPGDIVVELGGKSVTDLYSYTDALYGYQPGQEIQVVVLRGTERIAVKVTLGKRGS